ncbi:hypothetical protein CsSME_00021279 [Camellia sinensis var. sinensis]
MTVRHETALEKLRHIFHNIYRPFGTWKGGREKAPAAFYRKAFTSIDRFEMWGDRLQTRSFTFIDECVRI